MLDPWLARYTEYINPEDFPFYMTTPVGFCKLIYVSECMTDLYERF